MTGAGTQPPGAQGLYDPRHEHDACGVGFVVNVKGRRSHTVIEQGLQLLINLQHRGACGCEANSGDGAGILIQMPDRFMRKVTGPLGIQLPEPGQYGAGLVFLPRGRAERRTVESLIATVLEEEDLKLLGWREVPADNRLLGARAVASQPVFQHLFVGRGRHFPFNPDPEADRLRFERKLYVARKRIEHEVDHLALTEKHFFYIVSLSARTLIYKGMLKADQIAPLFPDLADPDMQSALALVHQRFSTNTFPSWPLAHPYRFVAHNGEINTLRGNINWMRAREGLLQSPELGEDLAKILPIIREGGIRHGHLRQRARVPRHDRAVAAARRAHDDSGALERRPQHRSGTPGVLRVPLLADGGVGRAGVDRVHRRHGDRSRARPQRAAALALLPDDRRSRHHGLGGRSARRSAREDRAQGAAASGQDLPRRYGPGPHRGRR